MSDASMNMNPTTALTVRDPWAMVPSLGNLDAYISAANRLPLLTQEEEVSLARRLRASGDLDAAGDDDEDLVAMVALVEQDRALDVRALLGGAGQDQEVLGLEVDEQRHAVQKQDALQVRTHRPEVRR